MMISGGLEGLAVVNLALTERDFTFAGEFFPVQRPTTIATRPLQDRLPVGLGGSSRETRPRTRRSATWASWSGPSGISSRCTPLAVGAPSPRPTASSTPAAVPPPGTGRPSRSPASPTRSSMPCSRHRRDWRGPAARRDLLPRGGAPARPRGDPGTGTAECGGWPRPVTAHGRRLPDGATACPAPAGLGDRDHTDVGRCD